MSSNKEVVLADFAVVAQPEIEKLAKHYNVQEPAALEAYGHIMALRLKLDRTDAPLLDDCLSVVKGMLAKGVDKLSDAEVRIGFCLGLLRVKQKPFLSDPKLHTGRNEKCPCGSGAKFKNCCLLPTKKHDVERYNASIRPPA